jgi:hypothetical protein
MLPFHIFKERRNAEFRLQEAETHSWYLSNASWLRRYQGSARPGSDCVAVLGSSGGNDVVLLGGQHRQVQALLKCATAAGIAVESVRNAGNYLVGAMRGSGKNALGHGTFTPVGELVLVNTNPLWRGWVLLLGLVPWRYD